jgi:hypothetical protein
MPDIRCFTGRGDHVWMAEISPAMTRLMNFATTVNGNELA